MPRPEFRRAWRQLLNELDIECSVTYQPQPVSQLLEGMADLMAAQRLPCLDDDFDARDLPPGDATWQIDFFHQPTMITNDDKRLFAASRWCYLGSIDDWFPLFGGQKPLSELAKNYCPHIGEESFFELM